MEQFVSKNNLQLTRQLEEVEYSNSIGRVAGQKLWIYQYSDTSSIDISQIKKIYIKKRETFFYNVFSFGLGTYIGVQVVINKFTKLEYLFLCSCAFIAIYLAFTLNTKRYKILIYMENYNFIEVDFPRKTKEEALKLINTIRKKIKIIKLIHSNQEGLTNRSA